MNFAVKLVFSLLIALLAMAASAAHAWDGTREKYAETQAADKGSEEARRFPRREAAIANHAPRREHRPEGRLSDEERRALRRDVDRANREIYKAARRQ